MRKNDLFPIWGILFILCAGLGFFPEPEGALRALLTTVSLIFFVPPAVILYQARQEGDAPTIRRIRNCAAASLAVTLVLIVLNILTAMGSAGLGTAMHVLLVIFSAPMVCSGYWALSLFLWACLLMAALRK